MTRRHFALLQPRPRAAATLLALAALALAMPGAADTYKWTDEKGVIHYTDKMPAEEVNKAATVLDKQARPVRKIDAPLTPEQRQAQEAEAKRLATVARSREEAERQDRALMQSFSSPEEIELSKHRAVATIDTQLESTRAYVAQLEKRKAEIDVRKSALNGKPVPDSMERELASIDGELQRQDALITQRQQERAQTIARYDGFSARWQTLKAAADAKQAGGAGAPKAAAAK